jgi:pilus assembly protein Flp/PilA
MILSEQICYPFDTKEVKTMEKAPQSEGQGLVEYALIISLVVLIVIVVLAVIGPAIGNVFSNVVSNI